MERVRDQRMVVAVGRDPQREGLVERYRRAVVVAARMLHRGEVGERRGEIVVIGLGLGPALGEGRLEQLLGARVEAEVGVDLAHNVHHRGRRLGLVVKLLGDPGGAPVEDLARGHGGAARLSRVGDLEDVDQEVRDAFGAGALAVGPVERAAESSGLDGEGERRDDDEQDGRAGRAERGAVATDVLGGAVERAAATGHDRKPLQVQAQVFGEVGHRGVAMLGLLAQRPEHDRVEVAAQPAVEAFRRQARRQPGFPVVIGGPPCGGARPFGLVLTHRTGEVMRKRGGRAIGPATGEQPVEEHAERVLVAGGAHRLSANLLGAGVLRCHQVDGGPGRVAVLLAIRLEQLGDAEVEQLGYAIGAHQDVARLEVTVDHEPLMGEVDRGADQAEELETALEREGTGVAVAVDGLALDVLHHQIRLASRVGADVEQASDARVDEGRGDLPFLAEAPDQLRCAQVRPDGLERDQAVDLAVRPPREVDGAHAALTEDADDLVGSDAVRWLLLSRSVFERGLQKGVRPDGDRLVENAPRCLVGGEQRGDLLAEDNVVARRLQPLRPFLNWAFESLVEQVPGVLPAVSRHDVPRAPRQGYRAGDAARPGQRSTGGRRFVPRHRGPRPSRSRSSRRSIAASPHRP